MKKKRASLITWENSEAVVGLIALGLCQAIEKVFRDDMPIKQAAPYMDTWSQQDIAMEEIFWGKNTVSARPAYNSGSFVCGLASVSSMAKEKIDTMESQLLEKSSRAPKYGDVVTRHVKLRRQRKRGPKKHRKD